MRIFILLGLIIGNDAWAESSAPPVPASSDPPSRRLEPIDRAALPALLVEIEAVSAERLISPIICERIRTIRSWIPRRVCVSRVELERWQRNRSARVAHDISTLREILRYQNRGRLQRSLRY